MKSSQKVLMFSAICVAFISRAYAKSMGGEIVNGTAGTAVYVNGYSVNNFAVFTGLPTAIFDNLPTNFSCTIPYNPITSSKSIKASYELYETSVKTKVTSVSWLKNLKVSYMTFAGSAGAILAKESSISKVDEYDIIYFSITGDLLENATATTRECAVKLIVSVGGPYWIVISQRAGSARVKVSFDSNGASGSYSPYTYYNGTAKGYLQQYLPSPIRDGYEFDAWYSVSHDKRFDGLRVDESLPVTAAITSMVARWKNAPVANVSATTDSAEGIIVSWQKSVHDDVMYNIYRSECETDIGFQVAQTKRNSYMDMCADYDCQYYYRVETTSGSDDIGSSLSGSVLGCRMRGTDSHVESIAITNVVVHYVTQSIPSEAVVPPVNATGLVNVITEVNVGAAVAISPEWTEQYPDFESKFGNDFTKAVTMQTGKMDGSGKPMMVWQDFVAGTDPTDPDDKFTASITFDKDTNAPIVSWTPELSQAEATKRSYKKYGKVKLNDPDWIMVPDGEESNYNFFKVTVEMK